MQLVRRPAEKRPVPPGNCLPYKYVHCMTPPTRAPPPNNPPRFTHMSPTDRIDERFGIPPSRARRPARATTHPSLACSCQIATVSKSRSIRKQDFTHWHCGQAI